ncbi:hypothetical protein Tco_1151427 [Tanacetum coccineum]
MVVVDWIGVVWDGDAGGWSGTRRMDWLSEHQATIESKRGSFGNLENPKFVYNQGAPTSSLVKVISAMGARKLIRHGCKGYLTTIQNSSKEDSSLEDQPIGNKFPDVFPEELSGLLITRSDQW